ncbi:MAG: preprotein translocase subunit SecE [Dethiobacteria bacterium]|nr:preprotein translocase subunit SecE [Dethiobacteria bacterium]
MRFFKRLGKFLHEVRIELKKVHWPTKREFSLFTGIVISVVLVVGVFFWLLDTAFLGILQLVIR